jgi:hypothetical protein
VGKLCRLAGYFRVVQFTGEELQVKFSGGFSYVTENEW